MDRDRRRHAGEFIILAVYLAADVFGLWNESHFWTLVVAIIGIGALAYAEFSHLWFLATVALSIVSSTIIYFRAPPILPTETPNHGWLLAANDRTPLNGCSQFRMPSDALLFIAGTNAAWTQSKGKSTVLSIGGTSILSVERDGDRLAFDADIFDEAGELVVRVVKNEFHLISGKFSYADDRTADRSTLAVFDKFGKEMLFVKAVNKTTVVVRGRLMAPDHSGVFIDDQQMIVNFNGHLEMNCKAGFSGPRAGFVISKNGFGF